MIPLDMPRTVFDRRLIALLVGAALLRVALLAYVAMRPGAFDFPDSHRYVRVARNIADGRGPMETEQIKAGTDPAYPAMLAIGIKLGINSTDHVMMFGRAVNSVCGMALVALVAFIGIRCFSARVALIAATWVAIDPILLFFNALVLTELVYTTLLAAALLYILKFQEARRIRFVLIAGALLGAGTLTRSSGLLVPLVVAMWLLLRGDTHTHRASRSVALETDNGLPANQKSCRSRSFIAATALVGASIVVLLPTTYRNLRLFGEFVPVHTSGGATLLDSFGPWADGATGMDRIEYPQVPENANEVERDRIYRRWAMDWAASHPADALRLAGRKLARTWSITINAAAFQSGFYATVCWLTVAPVFALALFGVWRERRRPRLLALLLLPAAYFTLVHIVFVGSVRYRLPALPFIFLLAAVGFDALIERIRGRSPRTSS